MKLGTSACLAAIILLLEFFSARPALAGDKKPAPKAYPLLKAVEDGDSEAVRSLLRDGFDPNRVVDNWTALHQAMIEPDETIIRLLLDAGADVNAKDVRGDTPLHWAVLGGQERIVDLLISKGAEVDVKSETLSTPLHDLASAEDRPGIARALIKAGADPNARDEWGRTPLHWHAVDGKCETVDELIDAGADVNALDKDGYTPLHRVANHGKGCASTLLRRGAEVDKRNPKTGWTALHCTAYGEGTRVAYKLLMAGADLFARDRWNRTAVQLAAYTSNKELKRFLTRVHRRLRNK